MGSNGKNNGKQWKNNENNTASAYVGLSAFCGLVIPNRPPSPKASAGRLECNLKLHS
jgi:hypothetical protein